MSTIPQQQKYNKRKNLANTKAPPQTKGFRISGSGTEA